MGKEITMFDFADFYDSIAEQMPNNCRIVEVGVADGDSALYLAERLYKLGKQFTLYMVDDMSYGQYNQIVSIYENIINSALGRFIKVIPFESIEASKKFNDNDLDFVFIDASHQYEQTKNDIRSWYAKVKDEGILAGHDYWAVEENPGVQKAVQELIPRIIRRNDIPNRIFDAEQFLHDEKTKNNFGVWWVKKDFYKKLNIC